MGPDIGPKSNFVLVIKLPKFEPLIFGNPLLVLLYPYNTPFISHVSSFIYMPKYPCLFLKMPISGASGFQILRLRAPGSLEPITCATPQPQTRSFYTGGRTNLQHPARNDPHQRCGNQHQVKGSGHCKALLAKPQGLNPKLRL